MKRLMSLLMLAGLVAPIFGVTGCGSNAAPVEVEMAHHSTLPTAMQNAPERVREAYQYAAANPEPLKNVPCYCGCGPIGHTNNYDCYIKDAPTNGTLVFDDHALGCSICVDITHDVVRMTREGRSPPEIRRTINTTYGRFGPSNFE